MKTTFDAPCDLIRGRIAHVVYRVDGEATSRTVTTGVDENVSDAVCRDLVRARAVPVAQIRVAAIGSRYEYRFVDGVVLTARIL